MTLGKKIILGLTAVLVVLAVVGISSVIGINNNCVRQENGIVAQYKQNQNNYDNMFKKFKEAAAVPSMYTDDLRKVYDSAIQARYGSEGSKAAFQWLKEHNPNFDSKMYVQLQRIIESGRNDFENNQKMLLDKKRQYENDLGTFPEGWVAGKLGFPKKDLEKYDIVTSDHTDEAFSKKKSDPIQLR